MSVSTSLPVSYSTQPKGMTSPFDRENAPTYQEESFVLDFKNLRFFGNEKFVHLPPSEIQFLLALVYVTTQGQVPRKAPPGFFQRERVMRVLDFPYKDADSMARTYVTRINKRFGKTLIHTYNGMGMIRLGNGGGGFLE